MKQTELLCKIEQLRAVASRTPYIERVAESVGGGINIHYKPVTLNKAVIRGLYLRVSSDGFIDLRQSLSRSNVNHPHYSSPRLCSDGHHRLTQEFERGRMENLLTEGLISFSTVNQRSVTNVPPGVFNCSNCGEAIMDYNWQWLGDGTMSHTDCMVTCSCCGRKYPRDEVKRRAWPLSGLRRLTCDSCIRRMQASAKATCIYCKSPVYGGAGWNPNCGYCQTVRRNMHAEAMGYPLHDRRYGHE